MQVVSTPSLKELIKSDSPQNLVSASLWWSWKEYLARNWKASLRIEDIAAEIGLYWTYVGEKEKLSDYFQYNFDEICTRFSTGKARTLILCFAKAVMDGMASDVKKNASSEKEMTHQENHMQGSDVNMLGIERSTPLKKDAGDKHSNSQRENQVLERCYWLGITDPYQIAIFSALSVKSEMLGNTENIIREAVRRVDPAMREETFSKVHEAANELVSHKLIKVFESSGRYLYYVNPKFWKRRTQKIKIETLAIHKLLAEFVSLRLFEHAFAVEIRKYLAQNYGIKSSPEAILLHLRALSRENGTNCIKLVADENESEGLSDVVWDGDRGKLSEKIVELSKSISGAALDTERDENDLEIPASSDLPVSDKVENILKNSKQTLHYREIEEKIAQEYKTRHSANAAANNSPNIIRVLPGVFVHKENFDEEFEQKFDSEKVLILDFVKEEIIEASGPVLIEDLANSLFDTVIFPIIFQRFSKMSILSTIANTPQMNSDFLIIPTPGNPRKRSIILKSIYRAKKQTSKDTPQPDMKTVLKLDKPQELPSYAVEFLMKMELIDRKLFTCLCDMRVEDIRETFRWSDADLLSQSGFGQKTLQNLKEFQKRFLEHYQKPTPESKGHLRVGEKWDEEEERELYDGFVSGKSIEVLAEAHRRNVGGIRARLRRLGLISELGKRLKSFPEFKYTKFSGHEAGKMQVDNIREILKLEPSAFLVTRYLGRNAFGESFLAPDIEKLLKIDKPQDHIDWETWDSWTKNLREKAISDTKIDDIATQLGMEWPYSRRHENLSEYLDLDLNQICQLRGFGRKTLRTIILCVANCALFVSTFKSHKNVKDEGTDGGKPALKRNEVLPQICSEHDTRKGSTHSDPRQIVEEEQEDSHTKHIDERHDLIELILKSELSVRAKNVILENVSSDRDLVELGYTKLLQFETCGKKTADEILNFIQELRHPGLTSEVVVKTFSKDSLATETYSDFAKMSDEEKDDVPIKYRAEKYALLKLVSKSTFSIRAENVILGNVSSIPKLIGLNYSKLLQFKNCGIRTAKEIMDFIQELRPPEVILGPSQKQPVSQLISDSKPPGLTFEEKTKSSLASSPTMDNLTALPFFSSRRLDFLSEKDLHPDYKASLKLSDIEMSVRTSKVLRKAGYNRLGQLVLGSRVELLEQKNFGRKSLDELMGLVTSIILPETTSDSIINVDYPSYSKMINNLLGTCKLNGRDQEIVLMRLLPSDMKLVTLDEIGQIFSLSKERVRQVLNKSFRKLRHGSRANILKKFWSKIDEIIDSGGGFIGLDRLAEMLESGFKWEESVSSIALKELMVQLNREEYFTNQDQDILMLKDCECLDCDVPVQSLSKMFTDTNSAKMNIWVVNKKILNVCQSECTYRAVPLVPVSTFHRAFLERAIDKAGDSCILHEDLVFPRNQWDLIYGANLPHVSYTLLEGHGSPLHFSELAKIIRKTSDRYSDVSDARVHSILGSSTDIQLFDRGTYGLSSWSLSKYQPASKAIEELFEHIKLPMKRRDITVQLNDEYKEQNISAALGYPKFHRIGEGYYDLSERWSKRTCDDFIAMLSEPGSSFARYVVTNNNFSYKLVMALIFLRGMDETGSFNLHILKDRFINFYLARQKKGRIVESESATVSRIGELDLGVIKDRSVKRPIESFINSGFFSKDISTLWVRGDLVNLLADKHIREIVLLTVLKGIDDYFARIDMSGSYKQWPIEDSPKTGESHLPFSINLEKETTDGHGDSGPSITIKKKTKGRIRL